MSQPVWAELGVGVGYETNKMFTFWRILNPDPRTFTPPTSALER